MEGRQRMRQGSAGHGSLGTTQRRIVGEGESNKPLPGKSLGLIVEPPPGGPERLICRRLRLNPSRGTSDSQLGSG